MPASTPTVSAWSPWRRLAFRFGALYFALYALPFPLDMVPGGHVLGELYTSVWNAVVPWVGNTVLGIDYEIIVGPNGSGDTTADYVELVMMLVMALGGAGLWSALDRRRQAYPTLAAWLTVWARYWLGALMVAYGFAKVFVLQFPYPDAIRLTQTIGETSPMGLLWTFMGYSPAYNVFTGGVEVLGGVLLLWRRTTIMGALVCMAAMTQVVVLNFCYDVPVKLFSSHLLLVSTLLAAPRLRDLFDAVQGRAVSAHPAPPPVLTGRWGRRVRLLLKVVFLGLLLVVHGISSMMSRSEYGPDAPTPPLYGVYDVVEHERSTADERPVITTDENRWRQLSFGRYGRVKIRPITGDSQSFMATVDEEAGTVELQARPEPGQEPVTHTLRFERPDDQTLVLHGAIDGVEHHVTLHTVSEQDMLLVGRGFNWINEHPFNR